MSIETYGLRIIVILFMKCFFRSFDVGIGDCNVIRLVKDDDTQYVIMVDCGSFKPAVKKYVEEVLKSHINLLVATHIDGDHIVGISKMLKTCPKLKIDHIWYNCYRRHDDEQVEVELTEEQKEVLQWIKSNLPVEFDAINYRKEISADQGKPLAECILENEDWNRAWEKNYITDQTPDFELCDNAVEGGNNFGKLVLLGPKPDAMDAIEKKFKDAFNNYFMEIWNDNIAHGESLSELLIRLADAKKEKFKVKTISATVEPKMDATFVRNAAQDEDCDSSDTNYSSIAFMLECGQHKVAMLGDAFASTLEDGIDAKYKTSDKPIICDAIKVSHHGSNCNSSKTLLGKIASHKYFIPGGRKDDYPTWGTFGRIALSNQDGEKKMIVFSHKGIMSEKMNGLEENVKEELKIETNITDQEYVLFEW